MSWCSKNISGSLTLKFYECINLGLYKGDEILNGVYNHVLFTILVKFK